MLRGHRVKLTFTKEMLGLPRPIKMVSLAAFVYTLGWAIIDPFFFIYLKNLFGSYSSVGLITALLYFFAIIWSIPIGQLLNRVSEKIVIVLALVLYFPMGYLLLALKTFFHFTLLRVYNSFTAASLWVSFEDYVREHTDKRRAYEAFGMFDTLCSLAYVIGPVIGALLLIKYGFSMFYVISITSFLAFLIALTLEDHKKEKMTDGLSDLIKKDGLIKKGIKDFFKNKKLVRMEIVSSLYGFAIAGMVMLLPLFLKQENASYMQIGIISSLYYIPLLSESYFAVLKRKNTLLKIALLISAVLLIAMFLSQGIYQLFILVMIFSLCEAAILSVFRGRLTNCMPKKEIGELSGVEMSMRYMAAGLGLVISGIIGDLLGLKYVFIMVAITLLSIFLLISKKRI